LWRVLFEGGCKGLKIPDVAPEREDPRLSARAAGLRYVSGEGPGISRRRRGKGFEYLGVDGKPVREKRTLERIRSLAIPPAWTAVWICPVENGHIQAVGRDAKGRKQYRYHARYRQVRDEVKFDRMIAFGQVLPKIRKQVEKDLSGAGLSQAKVIAAIVRLSDETCMRIGNDEYAKENGSYGLTTLRVKHADVERNGVVRLHFRGKSGQTHNITLRDRRLARVVKQCQDLPGQEPFQYQNEDGEYVRVDSADVNSYLRAISAEITDYDVTAKDFRTWHGSCHMAQQLTAFGPGQSQTESKKNIVQAVNETAKRLGNRPAACRKYYIHPAIFDSYIDQTIFSVMNWEKSPKSKQGDIRPEEAAVLRLIESHAASASQSKAS
jgi:DNA topoisomerase-1